MKQSISVLITMLLCLLVVASSGTQAQSKGKKEATVWPSADMKWSEMKGTPPGVKIMYSNLWGNVEKGAYGAIVTLPANMNHPLHTHTASVKLVVMSGTFWYQAEGGEKKVLEAGSYLMVPAGLRHLSGTGDQGCTVFQESSGAFDMIPVEADKK